MTVLSGVGVGGGSLVYANTLPVPKDDFFAAPSWGHLADWKSELDAALPDRAAHARRRAVPARDLRRQGARARSPATSAGPSSSTRPHVAVYFGEPGKTVPDPYFGGEGPTRTGCIHCGALHDRLPHGAKNTLDKNYLYLAEKRGLDARGRDRGDLRCAALEGGGYRVDARTGRGSFGKREAVVHRATT